MYTDWTDEGIRVHLMDIIGVLAEEPLYPRKGLCFGSLIDFFL